MVIGYGNNDTLLVVISDQEIATLRDTNAPMVLEGPVKFVTQNIVLMLSNSPKEAFGRLRQLDVEIVDARSYSRRSPNKNKQTHDSAEQVRTKGHGVSQRPSVRSGRREGD